MKQFYDQALQQAVVDDDANNAKAVVKTFHETVREALLGGGGRSSGVRPGWGGAWPGADLRRRRGTATWQGAELSLGCPGGILRDPP